MIRRGRELLRKLEANDFSTSSEDRALRGLIEYVEETERVFDGPSGKTVVAAFEEAAQAEG